VIVALQDYYGSYTPVYSVKTMSFTHELHDLTSTSQYTISSHGL